ncbi:MAG: formylglycine-generating enzyme family protein [Candidatus Latescibacteria bacterium]|nr:formylglycine-generating enzyme family protein [Candidatus Latescibacterota bacterium]
MKILLIGLIVALSSGSGYANEEITADLPGGAQMEFAGIEPGTFTMGDAESGYAPHQVTISKGFYLGRYEITQEQWKAVMGTSPWSVDSSVRENPNHPAVYISWNDVQAFIHKLNQAAGDSLYRLPSEAEWEYACRAGTTTRWSFGDDESQLKDYAWYEENANREGLVDAHAVGTKLPNPWGLYDMHGNLWEWVQDWYGIPSSGAQIDPQGPSSGKAGLLRGGSFFREARALRSASRTSAGPHDNKGNVVGARLLRMGPKIGTAVTPQSWGQLKKDAR